MAKKRRAANRAQQNLGAAAPAPAAPADRGEADMRWPALLLALTMFLLPALGATTEELLQDTLKSIVVSFAALFAALAYLVQRSRSSAPVRWHALLWLPLLLMAYALGSMVWSHTFLAGVEAIRWFIFFVLMWVGVNVLSRQHLPLLAAGIHWGAVVASLWAALQFWSDMTLFPQGPNPASTFVNRNFFAEFVVCTVPFSLLLVTRAQGLLQACIRSFFTAFNLVALFMTGTRSALIALLLLLLLLPMILWRYRVVLGLSGWTRKQGAWVAGIALLTIAALGSIPTGNPHLLAEQRGTTAIARAVSRSVSMAVPTEYTEGSFSVRYLMWKATARLIATRPWTGVGAGAWEVDIPLYQDAGAQLETDYYVHNEILQLLAEYGLVGWVFLVLLLCYLVWAAWHTWRADDDEARQEAPYRALALSSLLVFLVVSNAGFPWRMASTGALFALLLALLAASDMRLKLGADQLWRPLPWGRKTDRWVAGGAVTALCLTSYISYQAVLVESKVVRAAKIALTISRSGNPNDPAWNVAKKEMLQLVREGVEIDPHYRKITPMVADELARWGDWKNAVWIWESVLGSRPHVVAIMANIARGYSQGGNIPAALEYLKRAQALQPDAPAVRSMEVIFLSRSGQEKEAIRLTKQYFDRGIFDYDMVNAAYLLGMRNNDYPLAIRALQMRNQNWPSQAMDGWIKLAHIYASVDVKDEDRALEAFRKALQAAPAMGREQLKQSIPSYYRERL